MKYEQVYNKLPTELKQFIEAQEWTRQLKQPQAELHKLLTQQEVLSQLFQRMTAAEAMTLKLIVRAFGAEPFTSQALEKEAALSASGAQIHAGLTGLRRYGVIAAFRKAWGEQLFVLPEDGLEEWQTVLFPDLAVPRLKEENETDLEPAEALVIGERGLAQMFFNFLVHCARQKRLLLSAKGVVTKRQLQALLHDASLGSDTLRLTGLSYAHKEAYEPLAAVMLELAMRLHILIPGDDQESLIVSESALRSWLQLSYDAQETSLYKQWRQMYLPAQAWLHHGIVLMEKAASSQDGWYSLSETASCMLRCSMLAPEVTAEQLAAAFEEQWLKPLQLFRWAELAKDSQEQVWYRPLIAFSDNGEQAPLPSGDSATFYVQPDFELLLPPDVPLQLEWDVAAFADLHTSDAMRVYKLTRSSFHRACESGGSAESVLRFLQEHACFEVPEPVRVTLEQWGQQFGKLTFDEVVLLRCQSAEIADFLSRHEKSKLYLQERIGLTDFIVHREHAAKLQDLVERMGYHPNKQLPGAADKAAAKSRKRSSGRDASDNREKGNGRQQGLFYSRDHIQLYEIDASVPDWDKLYPDLQDIPAGWLKEFRTYHASTSKEIVRKAIEWKSLLRLRTEERERLIAPRALYEERAGWTLVGVENQQEIKLSADEWEQMKIILPGINDEEKEESLQKL